MTSSWQRRGLQSKLISSVIKLIDQLYLPAFAFVIIVVVVRKRLFLVSNQLLFCRRRKSKVVRTAKICGFCIQGCEGEGRVS